MKVGDLVRCRVTKDPNTIGVVVAIHNATSALWSNRIEVLTKGKTHSWGEKRLEVISASR